MRQMSPSELLFEGELKSTFGHVVIAMVIMKLNPFPLAEMSDQPLVKTQVRQVYDLVRNVRETN